MYSRSWFYFLFRRNSSSLIRDAFMQKKARPAPEAICLGGTQKPNFWEKLLRQPDAPTHALNFASNYKWAQTCRARAQRAWASWEITSQSNLFLLLADAEVSVREKERPANFLCSAKTHKTLTGKHFFLQGICSLELFFILWLHLKI